MVAVTEGVDGVPDAIVPAAGLTESQPVVVEA